MGERAKVILNEYSARNLLKRNTLDLDKFYTADLKLFVEVARKEIERLNTNWNELERYINEEYIYDELGMKIFDASALQDKLQELKGSDK